MRLFGTIVWLAPLGCKGEEPAAFIPAGVYAGPVTLDDTTVIVTEVDEAVLSVIFMDCEGTICAEAALSGTIGTALGDIGEGTMPVEELTFNGRRVSGKLAYNDSLHAVKGTFSADGLSLNAKINLIGRVLLDLTPEVSVELDTDLDTGFSE
jgi:hypothetical protein